MGKTIPKEEKVKYNRIKKMKKTKRKLMIRPVILSIVFSACLTFVKAQETPKTLNLKGAIEYSLNQNLTRAIYENKVEMAHQQNMQGLSGYLPHLNANFNFVYNAKLQTTVIPAGGFSPKEVRIQMGNPFVTSGVIQLDQKLYDHSNIVALKARKNNMNLARLNSKQNDVNIIYNTAVAYYQVLIIEQQSQLLQDNKKQYDDLIKIMQLQLEKGVITQLDYDRTRVALNNIKSQIALVETNQSMALNQLKMVMGMPFDEKIMIDTTQMPEDIKMPADVTFSFENRLDYQILNQQMILQNYDYRMKKASVVPTLSAYARYGANAYSKEFSDAFDEWFDYSAIGLKLNIPIFNGLNAHSQMKQSQLKLKNIKQNIKISKQNSQLEFESAKIKLYSSFLSYQQDKDNMELANSVYQSSLIAYQQGQATLTDFLNADFSLKQAQSNYMNSTLNFLSARLAYEKAKGSLSEYVNQL